MMNLYFISKSLRLLDVSFIFALDSEQQSIDRIRDSFFIPAYFRGNILDFMLFESMKVYNSLYWRLKA
jgi:hypothetical protein